MDQVAMVVMVTTSIKLVMVDMEEELHIEEMDTQMILFFIEVQGHTEVVAGAGAEVQDSATSVRLVVQIHTVAVAGAVDQV